MNTLATECHNACHELLRAQRAAKARYQDGLAEAKRAYEDTLQQLHDYRLGARNKNNRHFTLIYFPRMGDFVSSLLTESNGTILD
jgi:hypothetical protein